MFGTSHHITVTPARAGRKYRFVCSCGATGYETASAYRAEQMGQAHKTKASQKGRR